MVSGWYYVEAVFFPVLGAIGAAYGILQIQARKLPWNAKTGLSFMQKTFQESLVMNGFMMIAWGIDSRGVFGIYSVDVVLVLKDMLSCSMTMIALFWSMAIYRFIEEGVLQKQSRIKQPLHVTLTIHFSLIIIDITTTKVAKETGKEMYRGIWTIGVALTFLLCGVASAYSLNAYRISKKRVSNSLKIQKNDQIRSRRFNRKVGLVVLLCFASFSACFYLAIKRFESLGPLPELSPPDPENFTFDVVPIMFIFAILAGVVNSTLPRKDPMQSTVKRSGSKVLHSPTASKAEPSVIRAVEENNSKSGVPVDANGVSGSHGDKMHDGKITLESSLSSKERQSLPARLFHHAKSIIDLREFSTLGTPAVLVKSSTGSHAEEVMKLPAPQGDVKLGVPDEDKHNS
eukprot:TRINITY_DN29345_c0_g3_i2.p1 TRINITY_DN29345_c0_g3~~TRINITY_DN29345_c0_g3_i2.p1  ORF type:complete len:401 (+),score=79.73 TRINITY_DN29345_c0_g3_i2:28-1230(+)